MLTGISGSKIVERASMTCGFSFSVASGSATTGALTPPAVSFGGDDILLGLQRRAQRVPREAGALDPHRILAHAGEDGQLVEAAQLDRLIRRGGGHPVGLHEEV